MAYIGKSPTGTGVRSRFYFTQTSGGGTSISGTDDNSKTLTFTDGEYIDVYLNGVLLVAGTDYNTSTANTIGGLAALASGDVVEVVVYDIFTVADTVSATQGGTFNGGVTMSDGLTVDDNGAAPLTVDRATSDGDIITIQQDGSTVGTLGAVGDDVYLASPSGSDAGIRLGNNIIRPSTTTGGSRDNAIDLGKSDTRFKDLYLGGNLYIGGTGSANALEDYEEGTWTPTYTRASSNPTVTYAGTTGTYVKIGKIVTVGGRISTTAVSGGSGSYYLGGLPFTVENTTDDNYSLIVGVSFSTWPANEAPAGGYALRNQTNIALKTFNGDDARDGLDTSISSLTASGSGNGLVFTLTYRVA